MWLWKVSSLHGVLKVQASQQVPRTSRLLAPAIGFSLYSDSVTLPSALSTWKLLSRSERDGIGKVLCTATSTEAAPKKCVLI